MIEKEEQRIVLIIEQCFGASKLDIYFSNTLYEALYISTLCLYQL